MINPLALTKDEQEQIVAVLQLCGVVSRDDVFRTASKRLRLARETHSEDATVDA